jgi:hypothetical protein
MDIMFTKFLSLFKPQRKIAFLDGDQPLPGILAAHQKYLLGIETHLVRLRGENTGEPRLLRKVTGINKIYLTGYSTGKEVTDKFISAYIQKALHDGCTDITVVSSDYDFIDVFKLAVQLNPTAFDVSFRLIVPTAIGRLGGLPEKMLNIEIVKC